LAGASGTLMVSVDRLGGRAVRTRRSTVIRRRLVAGAVVLAAAATAPVAVAASTTHSSSPAVHTQVQKDGTVLVSGFDGGVSLQAGR
jgi:hypothetical protein